ncbi:hypothetical protein HPP92_010193 [Vanilla planifolia]|uniref:Uncharacterized protein n=1 Tax=Vanilla planifolia TaxID=51239 RepID=A0A835V0K2_VANPL|nr:hypothetical protein HPP92_010193 [Vanilla planifolia]
MAQRPVKKCLKILEKVPWQNSVCALTSNNCIQGADIEELLAYRIRWPGTLMVVPFIDMADTINERTPRGDLKLLVRLCYGHKRTSIKTGKIGLRSQSLKRKASILS